MHVKRRKETMNTDQQIRRRVILYLRCIAATTAILAVVLLGAVVGALRFF